MNERFRDAVTSAAFHFTLTGRQVEYLLTLARGVTPMHFPTTVCAFWQLERKGLVWAKSERGKIVHGPPTKTVGMTRAGELMVALLLEAGYQGEITVENSTVIKKKVSRALKLRVVA